MTDDEIMTLRRSGATYAGIAQYSGMTLNDVMTAARRATEARPNPWQPEHDALLAEAIGFGLPMSWDDVAAHVGMTASTCMTHARRLGLKKKPSPKAGTGVPPTGSPAGVGRLIEDEALVDSLIGDIWFEDCPRAKRSNCGKAPAWMQPATHVPTRSAGAW